MSYGRRRIENSKEGGDQFFKMGVTALIRICILYVSFPWMTVALISSGYYCERRVHPSVPQNPFNFGIKGDVEGKFRFLIHEKLISPPLTPQHSMLEPVY